MREQVATIGADSQSDVGLSTSRLIAYVLAYYSVWMAILTPATLTLAMRAAQIAPNAKEATLSLVLGTGAIVAMLANPIAGQLSDRTTASVGMRKPWFLGGVTLSVIGALLIASGGLAAMVAGWCIMQAGLNASLAALTAVLPDQVPEHRRGLVSGFLGGAPLLGSLAGVAIANMSGSMGGMLLLPSIVSLFICASFALMLNDRQLSKKNSAPFSFSAFLKSFMIYPTKAPNFSWAFVSRFFLFIGLATLLSYQVFFLSDRLGYTEAQIPAAMFSCTIVVTIAAVIGSVLNGWLSDRLKRRKIFVFSSAAIYAVGLLLIGYSETFTDFLIGIGVAGLGQGTYFAVDLALVMDVLPNRDGDAAKDLGIFNLASALPQTIAPAIAPIFLAIGSSSSANYSALFVAAATFAAIGAVAIIPIRSVR